MTNASPRQCRAAAFAQRCDRPRRWRRTLHPRARQSSAAHDAQAPRRLPFMGGGSLPHARVVQAQPPAAAASHVAAEHVNNRLGLLSFPQRRLFHPSYTVPSSTYCRDSGCTRNLLRAAAVPPVAAAAAVETGLCHPVEAHRYPRDGGRERREELGRREAEAGRSSSPSSAVIMSAMDMPMGRASRVEDVGLTGAPATAVHASDE